MKLKREFGGVALEYLIVSIFAIFFSVAIFGIITTLAKSKLEELPDGGGIESYSLNPFSKD